jgi:bifunctional non-homologous end joining protein LigD
MVAGMASRGETVSVDGRDVTVTNPGKVFFPTTGLTKMDLVRYYLDMAPAVLVGVRGRPMALKRYVDGVESTPFYQKRAPQNRPDWIETVELRYPSGRTAHEIVVRDAVALVWVVNLGCVDLHPHPVRAEDLAHPDELRVDLDPVPGVPWEQVRDVALVVREVLADMGLVGWPKTSGSRGLHVFCRVRPLWSFAQLRRAAQALAREVAERAPDIATSRWWKEERHGVFVDYNQNAKDRTTASAYSVRPTPDARVSTPLGWDEVATCRPEEFTIASVPDRWRERGDPGAGIDDAPGSLDGLLALAEAAGPDPGPPRGAGDGSGRRRSTMPLIEIARAETREEALAGLERWKSRHPTVWARLEPADVLVDSMRGRSSTWSRVRLNLRNVPEAERPAQAPLEVDFDPWQGLER